MYEILSGNSLLDEPFDSNIVSVARGPTTYHSVDELADSVLPLSTVLWLDTGLEVQLAELVTEPGCKHIRP